MKKLALVCLCAGSVYAQAPRVVAIAPPSAESPELVEAGLLMQAEASRWLMATGHHELHVKQITRALERHRITLAQLDRPEVAARARSLLGAPLLIVAKLKPGVLEIGGVSAEGPLPVETVALPSKDLVAAGGRALAARVAQLEKLPPPAAFDAKIPSGYAACYATLIRQPISVESPAVLGATELSSAVKSCRAAVASDPKFEPGWAALGLALAISGNDADAVQALIHVHADKELVPLYWLGRYWLVTRYQSHDAGLTALRQALKQHPGFLLARGYLAEHLMATGKSSEALDEWRRYSGELPKNAFLRGRVSVALARLGRHDEAIVAAKEALAIDPTDADAILELGSRYLDAGKRDEAITTLQPAANGNSRGELLLRLGWALFEKGELARAEALFRRAADVATAPSEWRTRARARADLARLFDSRGDKSAASESMHQALAEGGGAYLHAQRDKRILELVAAAETAPRASKIGGPRLVRPTEVSPFRLDPAGDIDLRARQFPAPPPQFELLRF